MKCDTHVLIHIYTNIFIYFFSGSSKSLQYQVNTSLIKNEGITNGLKQMSTPATTTFYLPKSTTALKTIHTCQVAGTVKFSFKFCCYHNWTKFHIQLNKSSLKEVTKITRICFNFNHSVIVILTNFKGYGKLWQVLCNCKHVKPSQILYLPTHIRSL